jgi:hypothetical protein
MFLDSVNAVKWQVLAIGETVPAYPAFHRLVQPQPDMLQ